MKSPGVTTPLESEPLAHKSLKIVRMLHAKFTKIFIYGHENQPYGHLASGYMFYIYLCLLSAMAAITIDMDGFLLLRKKLH